MIFDENVGDPAPYNTNSISAVAEAVFTTHTQNWTRRFL